MRLACFFVLAPLFTLWLLRHSNRKAKYPIIQAVMDDLKAERGAWPPYLHFWWGSS